MMGNALRKRITRLWILSLIPVTLYIATKQYYNF